MTYKVFDFESLACLASGKDAEHATFQEYTDKGFRAEFSDKSQLAAHVENEINLYFDSLLIARVQKFKGSDRGIRVKVMPDKEMILPTVLIFINRVLHDNGSAYRLRCNESTGYVVKFYNRSFENHPAGGESRSAVMYDYVPGYVF